MALELIYQDFLHQAILAALFQKHKLTREETLDDYLKAIGLSRGSTEAMTFGEPKPRLVLNKSQKEALREYSIIQEVLRSSVHQTNREQILEYAGWHKEDLKNKEWLTENAHNVMKVKDKIFIRDFWEHYGSEGAWYEIGG